ncbi:MAG: tyrosine-type recombinase/integrase, partial [Chromatiaceae bacterium]|nr:tyrosine-type recombinase/integrase [Chromatiaceae bacterium]
MAGKYARGATWYITWVEGKQQIRHRLGRVTEAEAEAARLAKEQSLSLPSLAGPQFLAYAVVYGTWHSHEYPDSYYRVEQIIRGHLIPFFKRRPLLTLTVNLVDEYKRQRLDDDHASSATVVKEIRTLKALMNHALETGVIDRNPLQHAKAPRILTARPPRWYTRDELARIYAQELAIPKETTDADKALHRDYRWVWQLLANSGMRRGEALQLRWEDVGSDEIRIVSAPGARTKSGKWRVIPITSGAEEALGALRQRREFVLPQISPFSVTRAFHRTLSRADLDGGV